MFVPWRVRISLGGKKPPQEQFTESKSWIGDRRSNFEVGKGTFPRPSDVASPSIPYAAMYRMRVEYFWRLLENNPISLATNTEHIWLYL